MKSIFALALLLSTSFHSFSQNFRAVGYMPSYRMATINDLNYNLLTHLMASFINPDEQGNMSWTGDIDEFVNVVHSNNAKAIISIGGGGNYSWGSKVYIYEDLLETAQSRTDFIHKIMNYIREHNLDGVDNDIEGNALALSTYNVFSQELSDSVHAAGLESSAAIGVEGNWGVNLIDQATLDKFDFVMTMSYGGVGSWNWSSKKDDQCFEKMKSDMEHFTNNKNLPAHKVVGGIPFYSVEYPSTAQTNYNGYTQTICSIYNDPQFIGQDPVHSDTLYTTEGNVVYVNSIKTLQRKMDFCNLHGGIMIWEVGQDCFDGSVNLLDSMADYAAQNALSNQVVNSQDLKIYPNPVDHQLNINISGESTIQILNQLGEVVIEKQNSPLINTEGLASGVYFIKVLDETNRVRTQKFLKK